MDIKFFGRFGCKSGQFYDPSSIVGGSDGVMYVCDRLNHRIQVFDCHGHHIREWGKQGHEEGQFRSPSGLTLDISTNIETKTLSKLAEVLALSLFPPGLLPLVASYARVEWLYVADTENYRLQVFQCDGTFIRMWGTRGNKPGQFVYGPICCALHSDEIVYVALNRGGIIHAFRLNGTFIFSWNCHFDLSLRRCLSIGQDGTLYLRESSPQRLYHCSRVLRYTKNGEYLSAWQPVDSIGLYSSEPHMGDVQNGRIWITNDRVLACYKLDGTRFETWSMPRVFVWEIAVNHDSTPVIYMTDYHKHQLVRIQILGNKG